MNASNGSQESAGTALSTIARSIEECCKPVAGAALLFPLGGSACTWAVAPASLHPRGAAEKDAALKPSATELFCAASMAMSKLETVIRMVVSYARCRLTFDSRPSLEHTQAPRPRGPRAAGRSLRNYPSLRPWKETCVIDQSDSSEALHFQFSKFSQGFRCLHLPTDMRRRARSSSWG